MKLQKVLAAIEELSGDDRWKVLQALAKPGRFYGDGGTIHSSTVLDVETHEGQVVSVWFRCQLLPFEQRDVDEGRAREMRLAQDAPWFPALTGVHVADTVQAE